MKSAAIVKTFTRKPKKAPLPSPVDFDTLRDTQNASDSSQDWTASQSELPDSQQSVSNDFDQLLVEPAPRPPSPKLASAAPLPDIPKPAPRQAQCAATQPPAQAPPTGAHQLPQRKSSGSLFAAKLQDTAEEETSAQRRERTAGERCPDEPAKRRRVKARAQQASAQAAPAASDGPLLPAAPSAEPPPAPRKRKEQPSSSSDLADPSAPRKLSAVSGAVSAQPNGTSSDGAAVQRSAGGGMQRPSGGLNGTAQRPSSGLATAVQRSSGGSQRNSGGSLASRGSGELASGNRIAAITLVEAQDSGESVRIMDDLMYALDGLNPRLPAATQHESAVAVAETALTQRGRMALRSDGAIGDVLKAADGLPLARDPLVASALAALLLCFARQPLDQPVLATPRAMSLLGKLLQVTEHLPAASDGASKSAAQAERVLRTACEAAHLPAFLRAPCCLALATLTGALDPHRAPATADAAKRAMREAGLLQVVALAADAALRGLSQLSGAGAAEQDRLRWLAHQSMLVLEHATFASPENEAHVVSLSVPSASPGSGRHGAGGSGGGDGSGAKGGGSGGSVSTDGGGLPFPQWLVGHLTRSAVCDAAAQPPPSPPAGPQAWVQAGLSVLMNVTHNNEAGRDAVAANDGLEALVQLVSVFAAACMDKGGHSGFGDTELLSSGLGVLINLAEGTAGLRARLAAAPVAPPFGDSASAAAGGVGVVECFGGGGGAPPATLVSLLCGLMSRMAQPEGTPSPVARLRSPSGGELTTDHLERAESAGAASILEAYSAMLLGFIVADDPELRRQAAAALPGGSLAPVTAAVERCLQFYVAVGAMTGDNERSLRQLVATLRQES